MEGTTSVVEEHPPSNHKSHDQVSKSVRSLIKIDSISHDLANAMDTTDAGKCGHFTIRGYASEMRKKDWKTGWPFPLDGNEKSEMLPPLIVPKPRWWRCHNCMQENCAENVANTSGGSPVLNCCSATGDDTAVLERSQHAALLDVIQEEGARSINPTAIVYSNRSQPGEKQTEAANNTSKGDENGSEVNRAREIAVSATAGATCRQIQIHERWHMDPSEAVKSTNCNQSAAEAGTKEAVNAFDEHSGGHPSLQVDEDAYANSLVKRASFPDKFASGSRKRNRKMRSIEELLAGKRDANTDIVIRTELYSVPMSISEASAEVSEPISSQRTLSIQENVPRLASKNKKRMTLEMRTSPHMSKKALRALGPGAEATDDRSSGSEEHIGAAGVGFQPSSKASLTEGRIEKGPVAVKKRQKRNNVVHESSSSEPFQLESIEKGPVAKKKRHKRNKLVVHESSSEERTQVVGNATNNVSLEPRAHIAVTDKGKGPTAIPIPNQQNSGKKRNKTHHDANLYWNNNMPREGPSMLRDQYNVKNGSIAAVLLQVQPVRNEGMAMQCRESAPQFTGGPASLQNGFPQVAQFQRRYADNMNLTPYSHFQGKLDAYFQRSSSCDPNSKKTANGFPVTNVKTTKNASRIESDRWMVSAGTSNKGKAIETQESSALSGKLVSDQRGESDEVMEIVQLMAKNQYERCLPDADSDKQPANNTRRAPLVDLNEEYVGGDLASLQEDNAQRQESQRNGKAKIGKNVGITKEKTIDYLSNVDRNLFNVSNLEPRSYTPSLLRPFPQYQETPSRGVHCFPTSFMNAQNSQWTGNVLWHQSSHSGLPSNRAYSTSDGTPQQTEAFNHHWPSMYPRPFVYNTAQMPANQGNFHGNHNLNFGNPGGSSSFDKKRGNADSEALVKTHAGYTLVCKHRGATFDASEPPPRLFQSPPFPYHTNTVPTPPTNDNGGRQSHISQRFPTIPTAGAFPLPFDHGRSLNVTNSANQVSLESRGRGKGKAKAKDSLAQNRGSSSSHPVLAASGGRVGSLPVPGRGMQKIPPHISNSVLFPQKSHAVVDVNKPTSTSAVVQPLKSNVQCTINRNPADFTIQGPENEYMIAGEDLILHTHTPVAPLNRAGTTELDGRKRRKKTAVPKEPARCQMP